MVANYQLRNFTVITCVESRPQSGVNNFHFPSDSERFGLLNGMALSVILFMQLSYNVCIRSASAKFIFLPGCLFAYLLFTYYTSELTAGIQQIWPSDLN